MAWNKGVRWICLAVGTLITGGLICAPSAVATTAAYPNAKTAFDYFVGKGLTKVQAAGIVGNLQEESYPQINPSQSNGGWGRGIAQWSTGGRWDTYANDNAIWYAAQKNESVYSLSLQLDFIWYELQTFPSEYGTGALQSASSITDATLAFQNSFEQCGGPGPSECDQAQRIIYADDALQLYGSSSAPSFASAFQSNTGNLWTESNQIGTNQNQGMRAGTSPSMTTVAGQHETAFQANTSKLIVIGPVRTNTGLAMAANTSPAIAASGTSFEVAYQASDGYLHTWTPTGGDVNRGQGMKPATSPAITATSNGYEIAFQANTSKLIVIGALNFNTQLAMAANTNPAIAATGASFAVDYQASTGYLHTWTTSGDTNRGQGMKPATSPAKAAVTGGYETAFQANTGNLIVVGTTNSNTGQGMKAGTSPAIAATGTTFHVAFQVNTGALYTWTNTGHVTNTGLGMNNTTSPTTAV